MTDSPDGAGDFFRSMTNDEIQARIALVREAKHKKGYRQQLTKRELDKILGPSAEEVLGRMSGQRRNMARAKSDNFGIIGVSKIDNRPTFKAQAHKGYSTRSRNFGTYQEAVEQRNAWAAELWPGIPEALCDMDAAEQKWGAKQEEEA